MTPIDPKERILDACLDEVLGGQNPPNLTDRVLRSLAEASVTDADRGPNQAVVEPPVQLPPTVANVGLKSKRMRRSATRRLWVNIAGVAAMLVVGVTVGLMAVRMAGFGDPRIADHGPTVDQPGETEKVADTVPDSDDRTPFGQPKVRQRGPLRVVDDSATIPATGPLPVPKEDVVTLPVFDPATRPKASAPMPDAEMVALINQSLKQQWNEAGVAPARKVSREDWCRRAYHHLVGREPTAAELQSYLKDAKPDKGALVDQLLASHDFVDYWSNQWANVLIGPVAGRQPEEYANREGLKKYLRDSLVVNKPYDQLSFELLTATGSSDPGREDFNGATNFLLAGIRDDAKQITGHTSRVFLGSDTSCVQCHDQMDGEGVQRQFWQLNSFFRQAVAVRELDSGNARLADRNFVGESGGLDEAEIFFVRPNGLMRVAYPVLPDGSSVPISGRLQDVNRRAALASWIVRSDLFSRALVNRVWAHFFHQGFIDKSDPVGRDRQPSHPELLAGLSNEFVAREYDWKSLTRWIVLSDGFELSGEISVDQQFTDAPYLGRPLFSHFYDVLPRAKSARESLAVIARAYANPDSAEGQALARKGFGGVLARATSDASVDPGISAVDEHSQLLSSMTHNHKSFLDRISASQMSQKEKVDHLFLAGTLRKPTGRELEMSTDLFDVSDDEREAVEAIWWALVSSAEYGGDR